MPERSYRRLLWTLVLLGASLDQAGKYLVFKWLYSDGAGGEYVLVPGAFKLLSQFTDKPEPRLIFGGVPDFLDFHWFEWPVFNIADCCLVCGAFLLLAQAMWSHPAKQPQESKEVALSA